ncbi:MAG: hypothetical protein QW502_03705 [Candidatus Bathyarchaeia archaeon]
MAYFSSKDIAIIAMASALWGVLNWLFSPIFFRMTRLPFLCDLIGFSSLSFAVWWVRKIGTASIVGLLATIINFALNPSALHFLGFTAASMAFDLITYVVGYESEFSGKVRTLISVVGSSVVSAAIAGLIIGSFFMSPSDLARWGGTSGWAGLHAIGGIFGGAVGTLIIESLKLRGIAPKVAGK